MKESDKMTAKARVAREIESSIDWLHPESENLEDVDRALIKLWEVALKAVVNYDFPASF